MPDEVLGGLNTQEIVQAIDFIRRLRDEFGLTVLWIEHVMGAIMEATDRVIVLDQGKILTAGTPEEIANDRRVIQAYLGWERYGRDRKRPMGRKARRLAPN